MKFEKQSKKRKNRISNLLPFLVIVCLAILGGCGQNSHNQEALIEQEEQALPNEREEHQVAKEDGNYVTSVDLAVAVKEKYQANAAYDYGEAIEDLARGDSIEIKLGYDVMSLPVENWNEVYEIYQDADLNYTARIAWNWDENTKTVTITPYKTGANVISTYGVDTQVLNMYPHSSDSFFDCGDDKDWGNQKHMYLVNYYNEETGEKLDKPQVRLITVKGELSQEPTLSYRVSLDGRLLLDWTKVPGAKGYMVCEATLLEMGFRDSMHCIAYTEDCSWEGEYPTQEKPVMNKAFKFFDFGEDDWLADKLTPERQAQFEIDYPDECAKHGVINYNRTFKTKYLCVVALSEDGTSMTSNQIDYQQLSSNLPYEIASYTARANGIKNKYDTIEQIPVYHYVEMCDGRVLQKLIDYNTQEATVTLEHYYNVDDDNNFVSSEEVTCLNLPYVVEGTSFSGVFVVHYYDEKNLEKDLQNIEEKEELIRMRGGSIVPTAASELPVDEDGRSSQADANGQKISVNEENTVSANSALSEYLAINMMAGNQVISLSEFPEAKDREYLADAFMEAYYQNPYILGVTSYKVAPLNASIQVSYDYGKEEQSMMQNTLRQKVEQVISQVIKPDMTDEEKEMAINEYLCSHITYDYEALVNAKESNYKNVTEHNKMAFNAYGALMEEKCVCQGYAGAFKLLADAAGLKAITVSGMLDGEVPHAWNKVKINDKWCIIDTTNNDSDFVYNALFNVPFDVSERVLMENKEYVMDGYLADYRDVATEYEYYHITDQFFEITDVVKEIEKQLQENPGKKIVIRTDYAMTEEDFQFIYASLYKNLGDDVKLQGCHWLGVICLY